MKSLFKVLGIIGLAIGVSFLLAFPIMWLWNLLIPEIFGLVKIGFWQALGISLLSTLLFKNPSSQQN